jgi:hypothetical protein
MSAAQPARPVRELLRDVLRSDADFAAFCQDHFPQVRACFTAAMDRAARVELLLAQVPDQQLVVARLRAFAPNSPAWGPQRASWPYVLLVLALLMALVGGILAWQITTAKRPHGATGALHPPGAPWYGARHKESLCRTTARALARSRALSRPSLWLFG